VYSGDPSLNVDLIYNKKPSANFHHLIPPFIAKKCMSISGGQQKAVENEGIASRTATFRG